MDKENISKRKDRHFKYFQNTRKSMVSTLFEAVNLLPYTFSDINYNDIDLTQTFFKHNFTAPILISSITGGSKETFNFNKDLAMLSEQFNIPLALGSIRAMLEDPALSYTYTLKNYAKVPFLGANIGAVQAVNYGADKLNKALEILDCDALFIHLNVIQELAQKSGDRNFAYLSDYLQKLVSTIEKPVIIKEIGAGFDLKSLNKIQKIKCSAVEIAGAGGSSFLQTETSYSSSIENSLMNKTFETWGVPTAVSLIWASEILDIPIISSGGIRSGLDIAKSIVLGAKFVGIAAPFVYYWHKNGIDGIISYVDALIKTLKSVMVAVGATDLSSLAKCPYFFDSSLKKWLIFNE